MRPVLNRITCGGSDMVLTEATFPWVSSGVPLFISHSIILHFRPLV